MLRNDVGGMNPVAELLGTRRLDRGEAAAQQRRPNLDRLAVAVIAALLPGDQHDLV